MMELCASEARICWTLTRARGGERERERERASAVPPFAWQARLDHARINHANVDVVACVNLLRINGVVCLCVLLYHFAF